MKILKYIAGTCVLLTLFFIKLSHAALDIELTEGINGLIPVTIVPFQGQGYASTDPKNVTAVVEQDLNHSGKLKAILALNGIASTTTAADYVLTGMVKPNISGDGKIIVNYILKDLSNRKKLPNSVMEAPILLSETYTVQPQQLRALAHRISDHIYQKLTGEKGIFTTKIAYVRVHQQEEKRKFTLEVADYDGFNPRVIVSSLHPLMSPAWSPDGSKLAYVSFEKGRSEIYISQLLDGKREVVSRLPGINGAPAFSPNGRYLALALSKNEAQPHIYVMDLATRSLSQITHGWSIDTEPAWSIDGQNILFTSDRGGSPQIYRVKLGGDSSTKVAERLTYDGTYNSTASYLPDGKQILLLHRAVKNFNIALLDLLNSRIFQLTQIGSDESPSAAPNGTMVLYATHSGGVSNLHIVTTDGRMNWPLSVRGGNVREPAWSPFLTK